MSPHDLPIFSSSTLRIVCTSDTHNEDPSSQTPPGDIFIHAGDIMVRGGGIEQLQTAYAWISALAHEVKIVIAGNVDMPFDPTHWKYAQEAVDLFTSDAARACGIHYLNKEVHTVAYYNNKESKQVPIQVYGNPRQRDPEYETWLHKPGKSAFNYPPYPSVGSTQAWSETPVRSNGVQVWVTHCPPLDRLDKTYVSDKLTGCSVLAEKIASARPILSVFGHFHASWGVERVEWNGSDNVEKAEILTMAEDKRKEENKATPLSVQELDFSVAGEYVPLESGKETLFVNASWMTKNRSPGHRNLPLAITLTLP